MAFKTSLTGTRFYTETDAYYVDVDNRPLEDLNSRDNEICDEMDKRVLGVVDISGSATPVTNHLPTDWSIVRNSTGNYTITHSLAFADGLKYGVSGTCSDASPRVVYCTSLSANSFTIVTCDLSGVVQDTRFTLFVTKYV